MLDATDKTLLTWLRQDARLPFAELGKKVHLSAPAVHARVKKLEQCGVIRNYTIRVNPQAEGKQVTAFIRINALRTTCDSTAKALAAFPEIEECHSVAGEDCMLVKVRTETPLALKALLTAIGQLPGFDRTVTTIALQTHFERG